MTNDELAALVRQMDAASVQLHAAMLHFDLTAGELRRAVENLEWERTQAAVTERLLEVVPDSRHHEVALGVVS